MTWQWEYFSNQNLKTTFTVWIFICAETISQNFPQSASLKLSHLCEWMCLQLTHKSHILFPLSLNIIQYIAHTKNLGLNYYIINIFICWLAYSVWNRALQNGGESVKNWSQKWAPHLPAANCQIIQFASLFEVPASRGPLYEASEEGALLKLGGAPTLIPSPTWLTVTTRHRGSLWS